MKYIKVLLFSLSVISSLLLTACGSNSSDLKNTDIADPDPISDGSLRYGNITQNNKAGSLLGGLFCAAEDKIFYSNFKDNGYIYSYDKKTESSELVVKMPARFINYYNNKLYFLFVFSDECFDTKNMAFVGELYCFDMKSGECEKLSGSQIITGLTVTSEGIYYSQIPVPGSSNDPPELWRLKFGEEKPEKCGYNYVLRSDDRLIDSEGIHELTEDKLNTNSKVSDPDIDNIAVKGACVFENKLITYSNSILSVIDLSSKDVFQADLAQVGAQNSVDISYKDCVLLENSLYIAYGSTGLCKIDILKNEAEFYLDPNIRYYFSNLYTDGSDLYALGASAGADDNGEILKIKLYMDSDDHGRIETKELI